MATAGIQLPFDLEGEQEAINRKKLLADVLQQRALQPQQGQMVSGHYVQANPLVQLLAPALQAYLGKSIQDKATTDKAALTGQYNQRLAGGLQDYFKTRDGQPGQVMTEGQAGALMNNDQDPGLLADPVKANPRRAAVQALTSGLQPLQALGQADLASIGKSTLTPKDLLGASGFDPKSRLAAIMAGGDPSQLRPESKEHVVGDRIFSGTADTGFKPVGDGRQTYGPVGPLATGPDGKPIIGALATDTNKPLFAPGGTHVSVDASSKAGNKFAETLAEGRAKTIQKSYDDAQTATKALDAIGSARQDLAAGIKSGVAAEVGLGLAKVGKALGLPGDPQISNTEAYRANMARETLQLVKALGSGTAISNADREFAEKASGGLITLDDKTMLRLVDIATATSGNMLLSHKRLLDRNRNAAGTLEPDLATFEVPIRFNTSDNVTYDKDTGRFTTKGEPASLRNPTSAGGTPKAISLDEYLRGR